MSGNGRPDPQDRDGTRRDGEPTHPTLQPV